MGGWHPARKGKTSVITQAFFVLPGRQSAGTMLCIATVNATWIPNLLPEHAERLQQLLDDPDG